MIFFHIFDLAMEILIVLFCQLEGGFDGLYFSVEFDDVDDFACAFLGEEVAGKIVLRSYCLHY